MSSSSGSPQKSDTLVAAPPQRKATRVPRYSRNARACTGCKKVKSKCEEQSSADGAACRRCLRLGLECIFTDAPAYRRTPVAYSSTATALATAAGDLASSTDTEAIVATNASRKRRSEEDVRGVTTSAADSSSVHQAAAAPSVMLSKDLTAASTLYDKEPKKQQVKPTPSPSEQAVDPLHLANSNSLEEEDSAENSSSACNMKGFDLSEAMESRCKISADGTCSVKINHADAIQASSLPPAVAGFIAFEEARTDLPAPVIFMRNCLNNEFCFLVNQAFQDRVMAVANFKPPTPGLCPSFLSGAFAVEDMKKMYALVDSSSQGLKAPSPTGGIIERSIKLEIPDPVRIRVRPPEMGPPAASEPPYPLVPCHVAVQVNAAVGPNLKALQVAFVARPLHELAAHSPSRTSRWFPSLFVTPNAVAGSAAATVAALMDKFSRPFRPTSTSKLNSETQAEGAPEAEAEAFSQPISRGKLPDGNTVGQPARHADAHRPDVRVSGSSASGSSSSPIVAVAADQPAEVKELTSIPPSRQSDEQQSDGGLSFIDSADMGESFMDEDFASLLDGTGPLMPLEDALTDSWS